MPWRGPQIPGEFPTLGWLVGEWIEHHCVVPDRDEAGEPFILPEWSAHYLLNLYRLHPDAEPVKGKPSRAFHHDRGGLLVEPQKKGKGPFSAAWICAEAQGPVVFAGWSTDDDDDPLNWKWWLPRDHPHARIPPGEPRGRPWPQRSVWIQVTAVSEGQTANVWRALLPMIQLGRLKADIPDTGRTRIVLPGDGLIEPVTSSSGSRRGQRIIAAVQDELQDWRERNRGRALADTQRGNLAGTGGRFLGTGNAWDPADGSVAQQDWEDKAPGLYKAMSEPGPGSIRNKRDRRKMLRKVYAGSWWVDLDRIESELLTLLERDPAQAEQRFLNRPTPGAGRAYDIDKWKTLARPGLEVPDGSLITIGIDGARYDDALAIVATDIVQAHQWPLFIDEVPRNAPPDYEHDVTAADGVMVDAFERFRVLKVYIDPQYIEDLVDLWQGRWGTKRVRRWLTSRPKPMAWAVRRHITAVVQSELTHDGDEHLTRHIGNAIRERVNVRDDDGRPMFRLAKETPDSPNKIDGAPAGILSWEARGDAIAEGALKRRAKGRRKPKARSMA